MKEKIKEFIKSYLPGFILGVVSAAVVVVYAETYFPSNQVTYDNTESGMTSDNVQTAIDELYNTCFPPKAGDQILEDQPLEKDEYECRYFFKGANPNNYITFNGENAGWRIISIECDGRIKIMKIASIGNQNWDTNGSNNWAEPASLNTYLNGTYYNSLNSITQQQIVASNFSIGSIEFGESNLLTQINKENKTKWKGKIALPTLSEYFRTNMYSLTFSSYHAHFNSYKDDTWMYNGVSSNWWTLTPNSAHVNSAYYINVTSTSMGGRIYADYQSVKHKSFGIRPALYLSSDVTLSGSGTQSDPYVVS